MPGPQVKRWDVYEALRDQGASKEKAARIANSPKGKKRGRRGRAGSAERSRRSR